MSGKREMAGFDKDSEQYATPDHLGNGPAVAAFGRKWQEIEKSGSMSGNREMAGFDRKGEQYATPDHLGNGPAVAAFGRKWQENSKNQASGSGVGRGAFRFSVLWAAG